MAVGMSHGGCRVEEHMYISSIEHAAKELGALQAVN